MKAKLILMVGLVAAVSIFADAMMSTWNGPAIPEGSVINVHYLHETNYPVRLYTNNIFWRQFATNQIQLVTVGTNGADNEYRITTTAPRNGLYVVTFTVLDWDGIESLPSNTWTQYFNLRAGGNKGVSEK